MSALDKIIESTFFDDFPELINEARTELTQLRAGIELAALVVDRYLSHYSVDVFIEPPTGQHGKTIDACSAAALRAVLPHIASDIRKLAAPSDDTPRAA